MIARSGRAFDASVLDVVETWGAGTVAVAVVDADGLIATRGPLHAPLPWASVTKLVTALAVLEGVRRGFLTLDAAAGPPGASVRHLLAHASGLPFEGSVPIAPPGRTRIYSNTGFDLLGSALAEAVGQPFETIVRSWLLEPLQMSDTCLPGRPSGGLSGPADDLAALAFELLAPRILRPVLVRDAATVVFPGLRGVLPGFGLQDPCDWGLGFEIRDGKSPHWTGAANSAATFGHFGASGTFLWVDPRAGLALVCLTDRPFGAWAGEAWPRLSDAVLDTAGTMRPTSPRTPAHP